jgi:hypothetical protein
MNTTPRLAVAAVATFALALAPAVGASAQPSHGPDAHLLKALSHLDRRLTGAVKDARMARLTDTDAASLRANVATDEATIDAAAAALAADGSDANLAVARDLVHSYRPQVYVVATNIVRHSEKVLAQVAELQPLVTPGSTDETDLATATGLLATVQAGGFTATTDGAALRAAQHAVVQAQGVASRVADDVAGG